MSDTSGLPNADAEGVPAEDHPERFEEGAGAQGSDSDDVSAAGDTGVTPQGAEDVTPEAGDTGTDQSEPPPADFDPADNPSNDDLVDTVEPPD
jgi:hypothetical protein